MKAKLPLLIISLTTFQSLAEEPTFISYIDCSLLAPKMFDFDRGKSFEDKAFKLFIEKSKGESREEIVNRFAINHYFRKGYIEGIINTMSYRLKINKGTAAQMLNEENYCEHYKW